MSYGWLDTALVTAVFTKRFYLMSQQHHYMVLGFSVSDSPLVGE